MYMSYTCDILALHLSSSFFFFFFFNDTATTEIYTLSLHDALPIYKNPGIEEVWHGGKVTRRRLIGYGAAAGALGAAMAVPPDRKSTRLNSSHVSISYAVFCLKKKKTRLFVSQTQTCDTY